MWGLGCEAKDLGSEAYSLGRKSIRFTVRLRLRV